MKGRFAAFSVIWTLALVAMSPIEGRAAEETGGGTCQGASGLCCLCLSADKICQEVRNTPGFYSDSCSPGTCTDFCLLA